MYNNGEKARSYVSKNKGKPKKKLAENKRESSKFPALDKSLNLKSRSDLIDYDYVHTLSEKDKKWLNQFTEEYTNAGIKKGRKNLHSTKALKKDCYDRNNARNRCQWTREKAIGRELYLEEMKKLLTPNPEDEITTRIDLESDGFFTEEGEIIEADILISGTSKLNK